MKNGLRELSTSRLDVLNAEARTEMQETILLESKLEGFNL